MLRGCLVVWLSMSAWGQETGAHYEALKQALQLSDSQLGQLEKGRAAAIAESQQRMKQAAAAAPVAGRHSAERSSSDLSAARWHEPGNRAIGVLDEGQKGRLQTVAGTLDRWREARQAIDLGLIRREQWPGFVFCPVTFDAMQLGLTESQIQGLSKLPPEQKLAVLDDAQRTKIVELLKAFETTREAIALGLIPTPLQDGEVLCP